LGLSTERFTDALLLSLVDPNEPHTEERDGNEPEGYRKRECVPDQYAKANDEESGEDIKNH
jgi:hypothetical protein